MIIPSFKHFKKPANRLHWRKILRQEKNGLLAIFITFTLLASQCTFRSNQFIAQLHYATAYSAAAYIALRTVKKHTKLLS